MERAARLGTVVHQMASGARSALLALGRVRPAAGSSLRARSEEGPALQPSDRLRPHETEMVHPGDLMPNPALERTAHQRCWWVPFALRAFAAAQRER